MRGRWADNAYWHRDEPDPIGPAPYDAVELLRATRVDQGLQSLIDEIADIVVDREAAWRRHAACAGSGPDLFFAEQGDMTLVADAVQVCQTCPVAAECDDYATGLHLRYGVWGGKAGRNRNRGAWTRGEVA